MLSSEHIETAKGVFRDLGYGEKPEEPPPVNGPDDYGDHRRANDDQREEEAAAAPLRIITPAEWPNEKPPPVDWLVDQRIPRGDVATLNGDGGAGKTDIALQLAESCARGAGCWLGNTITTGPVFIISAEEPEREIRRRMDLHAERDGYQLNSLANLHLWVPDDVAQTTLATAGRNGIMHATPLFRAIKTKIADVAPVLVIVDNVAATFAGNQNDRVMVRSYVNLWRTIAHGPGRPAVLLLDHPSLSGLNQGTGRGGNMDWRNGPRCALYLHPPEDKAEADRGIRVLVQVKNNQGPLGKPIGLQWSDGGLRLESSPGSLHLLAMDAECDEIFMRLLDEVNGAGRHASDAPSSTYAPKLFAGMDGNGGFTKQKFAKAMERQFRAKKITKEMFGPPSRQRSRIVRNKVDNPTETTR
jgi:RecA-family ATPase